MTTPQRGKIVFKVVGDLKGERWVTLQVRNSEGDGPTARLTMVELTEFLARIEKALAEARTSQGVEVQHHD